MVNRVSFVLIVRPSRIEPPIAPLMSLTNLGLIYDMGDLEQLGADGQAFAPGRFSGDVNADFVLFNDKSDRAPPIEELLAPPPPVVRHGPAPDA